MSHNTPESIQRALLRGQRNKKHLRTGKNTFKNALEVEYIFKKGTLSKEKIQEIEQMVKPLQNLAVHSTFGMTRELLMALNKAATVIVEETSRNMIQAVLAKENFESLDIFKRKSLNMINGTKKLIETLLDLSKSKSEKWNCLTEYKKNIEFSGWQTCCKAVFIAAQHIVIPVPVAGNVENKRRMTSEVMNQPCTDDLRPTCVKR